MPARQLEATVRWVGAVPVVDLRGDIDAPGEHVLALRITDDVGNTTFRSFELNLQGK